jgi:adenylate kinase
MKDLSRIDMMSMYLVMMGAPGAGKGTQAKKLGIELSLPHVSTGELFRKNLKNETKLGKLAQTYIDKGKLVPDDVTIAMVQDKLAQNECANGAILDGFPRNLAQAYALEDILAKLNGKLSLVPYIHVDENELVRRLLKRSEIEGRADDNEETIRARMMVFKEQTQPLLDYYKEKDLLVTINGSQSIDAVFQELLEVVRGEFYR